MIFDKPSNDIFASGAKSGESVDFPDVVRGWGITENTGFIPPMEYFNGAFNRVDKALMYLRQRGISEWDSTIEYPVGAIVQYENKTYRCLQQNTNQNPANMTEYWEVYADSYTKPQIDEKLKGIDSYPIGAYILWSSEAVTPAGFLVCDGRSLSKTEYAELFAVIGYTYGGSGESFNIPNFADGKFFRSVGGNAAPIGEAQNDAIRNITGSFGRVIGAGSPISGVFSSGGFISGIAQTGTGRDGLNINIDASKTVPTANENRPYNMSVVVLIKAKDVKELTNGQIDESIYATEAKAGITKLKNSITGNAEDAAVTEKAVVDYIEKEISINGNATFDNVKNNIVMSGIGSITLAVGDVIEVKGTSSNDKLFTVESIVSDDEIIVNYEHRGTSTPVPSKRLMKETAQNCVIKLYCRAKDAPLGLGQGWCVPESGRGGNVNYLNNTQRTIAASFYVSSYSLSGVSLGVYLDGITVSGMMTNGSNVVSASTTLVPPNSALKVSQTPNRWTELR